MWNDDETPVADQAIQIAYEAALGDFLVRFNRLENLVGDVLQKAFERLGRPDLHRKNDALSDKLHTLELVGLAFPTMHKPNVAGLASLNGQRNTLAHGHFDQNPFSGEYMVVGKKGPVNLPLSTIREAAAKVQAAIEDVQGCLAFLWFDER